MTLGTTTILTKPGVGYTLAPRSWSCVQGGNLGKGSRSYLIDLSALPYGPDGNGSIAVYDPTGEKFQARYRGGVEGESGWACGYCCELSNVNDSTLVGMFLDGLLGSKETYDGIPTKQESRDFSATHTRDDDLYKTYGFDFGEDGIDPANPEIVRFNHPEGDWRFFYLFSPTAGRNIYYEWSEWKEGMPMYQPGYPGAPDDPEPDPEPEPAPKPSPYQNEFLDKATVEDLLTMGRAGRIVQWPAEQELAAAGLLEKALGRWLRRIDAVGGPGLEALKEKYNKE